MDAPPSGTPEHARELGRHIETMSDCRNQRIPALRKGSFFPVILEPQRRIDQALYALVMEAYVTASLPAPSTTW